MKKLLFLLFSISLLLVSCGKDGDGRKIVYYEGEDISGSATIERNKETREATLTLNISDAWSLYAGASAESIDYSTLVADGTKPGTYPLSVSTDSRLYFQLVTEKGKALFSETLLPMSGGYNFRDLGGIKTATGKFVKWGKLLRSDEMSKLTPEDLAYLASIPLKSVVDFRTEGEIADAPDKIPADATRTELNIEAGNIPFDDTIYHITPDDALELLKEVYIELVTDEPTIAQYKEFFRMLQDPANIPALYHCTSGKDRTGMATALILFALGVDEETIYENYLFSNECLAAKNRGTIQYVVGEIKKRGLPEQQEKYVIAQMTGVLNYLLGVDRECLKGGIDKIKEKHVSVDNYLTQVLNVDLVKFRSMYLY